MNKWKKWVSLVLAFAMIFTSVQFGGFTEASVAQAAEGAEYEIYPKPHEVTYASGSFTLSKSVNVVFESGVDQVTKDRLNEYLTKKGFTPAVGTAVVAGKTNILVGIHNSNGAADKFLKANGGADDTHYSKIDAYELTAKDNTIAAVGKNTDAAYYALVTLEMVMNQITDNSVRNFSVKDYSDTELRGFIEGYYGVPWSNEDRMNLMKFGGNIKSNAYVFAPKDDPYHNGSWRTMYPDEELAKIKEMVQVGEKSKCRFIWTIHPFMSGNPIKEDNYEGSIATIKQKFEQLYSVGVRQFGVLADDAGEASTSLTIKMMNELTEWVNDKGDVHDLLYCPAGYNFATAGGSYDRLRELNKMSDQVKFFWTGQSVCSSVSKQTVDGFKNGLTSTEKAGRQPLFWLNWPVNDINKVRLMMGKGELLETDVTGLEGVISNPMQQSEPSKVAIFAICDYAWNIAGFDADKSWADSFKYIEPDASDALHTMAKHLSDSSPNGHGQMLDESEDIKALLDGFLKAYRAGSSIEEKGRAVITEFQTIVDATNTFEANSKNENLKEQMDSWTKSLRTESQAAIKFIETAIALEQKDDENVWGAYSEGASLYSQSKKFLVVTKEPSGIIMRPAESGARRLIPFIDELSADLGPKVNKVVNPNADKTEEFVPLSGTLMKPSRFTLNSGTDAAVTDNNDETFAWYAMPGDHIAVGEYIGLDLGRKVNLGSIKILQGRDEGGGADDYIKNAVVEYSLDGVNYTELGTYTDQKQIILGSDVTMGAKARYVRIRATAQGGWLLMREFAVSEGEVSPDTVAYTNVASLSRREVATSADTASLQKIESDITLNKEQYVGVMLPRIREVSQLLADYTQKGKLSAQTSLNGIEWTDYEESQLADGLDMRYFRVINQGEEPVTFRLSDITIKSNEIFPGALKETNIAASVIENPGNALDGDRSTKASFEADQVAGQYITYDLGQMVHVNKLKMVLHDAELDFIRNGKVSLSKDNENWTKVLTIGNGSQAETVTIDQVFPDHEISYYTLSNAGNLDMDARYVKIEVTKNYGARWIRFNEIEINDGAYLPVENDPTYVTSKIEEQGHQASYLADADVNTTYLSSEKAGQDGSVTYRVSDNTKITGITILQSPGTISNAEVSVRHSGTEWEKIGALDNSLNVFKDLNYDNIFEIKISWKNVVPELHEMYLVKAAEPDVTPVDKTDLLAKYTEADVLEEKYYTPETFIVLSEAVLNAEGVIAYVPATAQEVKKALDDLTAAIAGLIEVAADDSALRDKLAEAEAVQESMYTAESYSALTAAMEAARATLGKPDVKQKELDEKLAELTDAYDNLVIKGTLTKIPSNQLSAVAGSQQGSGDDGNADAAIDGDENTYWHSNWSGGADVKPDIPNNLRNEFTINVGKSRILRKLEYVPRKNKNNGRILEYKLYYSTSDSGDDFKEIPGAEGTWEDNGDKKEVTFITVDAKRLQIRAVSTTGDRPNEFISAAEFYVYEIVKDEVGHTASFASGKENATGDVPENMTAAEGGTITLPANPFEVSGFEFTGWSDGQTLYQPGNVYTMTGSDVVFTAQWKEKGPAPVEYKVSYVSEDSQGTAPAEFMAEAGETFTLAENTFTRAGFDFTGWSDGQNVYQPGAAYTMPASEVTFTAQWQEKSVEERYTAVFEGGEGAVGTAPKAIESEAGKEIILPANTFVKEGFDFTGWSNGQGSVLQAGAAYMMPAADVTFTAQWKAGSGTDPVLYTASFGGGANVTGAVPQPIQTEAGKAFNLPANSFKKAGYIFKGWSDGKNVYQPSASYTMPDGGVTFTAIWEEDLVTVVFDAVGGSVNPKSVKVQRGGKLGTLPIPVRSGYEFAGWYTAAAAGSKVSESTAAANNMSVYAHWNKTVAVPGKVTGLKASYNKTSSIKLSWAKAANATGYMVYRYNVKTRKYDNIKTTTANSYTCKKLKYGTDYRFRVKAYNQSGNTTKEGSFSSSLKTATAPSKPSLKVRAYGSRGAKLTWSAAKRSDGVELYMKRGNKAYSKITTVKSNKAASYKKRSLKRGTTYKFRMRRYMKVGSKKIYSSYSKPKTLRIK